MKDQSFNGPVILFLKFRLVFLADKATGHRQPHDPIPIWQTRMVELTATRPLEIEHYD